MLVEVSFDAEHHDVHHATCHKSCISVTLFVQRIKILLKLETNFQDPKNPRYPFEHFLVSTRPTGLIDPIRG